MSRNYLHLGALVAALALSSCTKPSPPPHQASPTPTSTQTPKPTPRSMPTVIVFAGHTKTYRGEKNSGGSMSASGIPEYIFNDHTLEAFMRLQYPSTPYLLVPTRYDVPLQKRPQFALDLNGQVYLELHHDSAQLEDLTRLKKAGNSTSEWDQISGFSIFYRSKEKPEESLRLAKEIGTEMVRAGFHPNLYHAKPIPGEGRTLVDPGLGVYDGQFLFALRNNTLPVAVLLECGVIANPDEEKKLLDPTTDDRIVQAIDRAFLTYSKEEVSKK